MVDMSSKKIKILHWHSDFFDFMGKKYLTKEWYVSILYGKIDTYTNNIIYNMLYEPQGDLVWK